MTLKGKILPLLKTKYKHLGFGERAFDAVATLLETTVTDESEIDNAMSGVEPLLKAFQGDADKRVTDAIARQKSGKTSNETVKESLTENDDVPAWAQGLIESNSALMAKVNALESGKTTESRREILEALLKDTPESFRQMKLRDFARMSFSDESEFETYKTELETGLEEVRPLFGEQGSGKIPPPMPGKSGKNGISLDTQAYIDARKAESEGRGATMGKPVFGEKAEHKPTNTGMGKQIFNS
ncbi:hypothetical protein [Emticicia agri]|uniref:Uncharacterized protein n=1 Tax=Emticicia agri TaxID=2492393 RepID=A0A4Q5LW90_9BACT|nr:hypothetical protein [Emticicia agri]RYU93817.1 hypothetical protein EWM59_20055 [Emticicia agri]